MLERNAKMEAIIVYENLQDRRLVEKINTKSPFFIDYIDILKDKNRAYKIKSHWGAVKNPFVEVRDQDATIKVFYSEESNAVQQFLNWVNNECKN